MAHQIDAAAVGFEVIDHLGENAVEHLAQVAAGRALIGNAVDQAQVFVLLAQFLFGLLELADVAQDAVDNLLAAEHAEAGVDGADEFAPVATAKEQVPFFAVAVAQHLLDQAQVAALVVAREEGGQRQRADLFGAVAEEFFGAAVGVDEVPVVRIDEEQGVARIVENLAVAALGKGASLLGGCQSPFEVDLSLLCLLSGPLAAPAPEENTGQHGATGEEEHGRGGAGQSACRGLDGR